MPKKKEPKPFSEVVKFGHVVHFHDGVLRVVGKEGGEVSWKLYHENPPHVVGKSQTHKLVEDEWKVFQLSNGFFLKMRETDIGMCFAHGDGTKKPVIYALHYLSLKG